MKVVVVLTLLASGCSLIDGLGGGEGTMRFMWQIRNGPQTQTCPMAMSTVVRLVSMSNADTLIDNYDCTDGVGETDPMPLGTYAIHGVLLGPSDNVLTMTPESPNIVVEKDEVTNLGLLIFEL